MFFLLGFETGGRASSVPGKQTTRAGLLNQGKRVRRNAQETARMHFHAGVMLQLDFLRSSDRFALPLLPCSYKQQLSSEPGPGKPNRLCLVLHGLRGPLLKFAIEQKFRMLGHEFVVVLEANGKIIREAAYGLEHRVRSIEAEFTILVAPSNQPVCEFAGRVVAQLAVNYWMINHDRQIAVSAALEKRLNSRYLILGIQRMRMR